MYFISVLFLENIEVCAKAHGQIWSGRLQDTLYISERLRLSSGHHAYGSAAQPLRPQKEYRRRHDNVAKKFQWDFCKKNGLEHTEEWYEHVPEGVVENEEIKVLWDINVQCDNVIETRRPGHNCN